VLLTALPVQAQNHDPMFVCLSQELLSRLFCKKISDFAYVGKVGPQQYQFHLFYGSRETKIFTKVEDHYIKVKGKVGVVSIVRSVPYYVEPNSGCLVVNYSNPECPTPKPIRCCPMASPEEQALAKKEAFWKRPIPEILKEELAKDNGTLQSDSSEESLIKPYDPTILAPEEQ